MLGTKNMTIGLLLCVLGVAVMAASHFTELPQLILKGAYGAITIGAIQFIIGILHSFVYQATDEGLHADDAPVSAMALIRCMVAVSIADGHLDESEIEATGKIYNQLTGSTMNEETIRDIAQDMQDNNSSVPEELSRIKNVLDKDLKHKIIKASLFILAADGRVDEEEEKILEDIRKGLGVSSGKFNTMKEKFLTAKGLS